MIWSTFLVIMDIFGLVSTVLFCTFYFSTFPMLVFLFLIFYWLRFCLCFLIPFVSIGLQVISSFSITEIWPFILKANVNHLSRILTLLLNNTKTWDHFKSDHLVWNTCFISQYLNVFLKNSTNYTLFLLYSKVSQSWY